MTEIFLFSTIYQRKPFKKHFSELDKEYQVHLSTEIGKY